MPRAVIALGANLEDVKAALRSAVQGLAATPGIELVAVSGLWRTAAVGGPEQPDYTNAVVLLDTSLTPAELLATCQALEQAAGRVRLVRWGPRTLDLDIIDIAGVTSQDPQLELPHPRAHERAFVLAPWAQVAPDSLLAVGDRAAPIGTWLAEVGDQAIAPLPDRDWWR